jgi:hypothetical protein
LKLFIPMKLPALALLTGSLALAACGDDSDSDGNGGGGNIDPSDVQAVSSALDIEAGVRTSGTPPAPTSGGAGITAGTPVINATPGEGVTLRVDVNGSRPITQTYLQVEGADEYFAIPTPVAAAGTVELSFAVPAGLRRGSFGLYACVADENDEISNPISIPVFVNQRFNVPDGVFCGGDQGGGAVCPNGRSLDFCINPTSGACFYVVGGQPVDCGNCNSGGGFSVESCINQTVALCTN